MTLDWIFEHYAMQIVISVMGIVITVLSLTGLYIWWKKRAARNFCRPG